MPKQRRQESASVSIAGSMLQVQTTIGIDQSYQRFGIAVARDGKLVKVHSIPLAKMAKTKREKREIIARGMRKIQETYKPDIVVVERVRLFSQRFISLQTIISLGGLIATILDNVHPIPVYSVDTRSWRARVVGSAKATKEDTVAYVKALGFDVDHDAADAACMALSPWYGVNLKVES